MLHLPAGNGRATVLVGWRVDACINSGARHKGGNNRVYMESKLLCLIRLYI